MKTAHSVLCEWNRRLKSRQQRRNRLVIADGYFRYGLMSHTFSGWFSVISGLTQEKELQIKANKAAYRACIYFADAIEHNIGSEDKVVSDQIVMRHIFTEFKENYERIREFKT